MAIYKISYANQGEAKRIRFECKARRSLSHYEVVCIAARHKMKCGIRALGLWPRPSAPDLMVQTNVQLMNLARIENVEFIIEGTTYIQCVPSVWKVAPTAMTMGQKWTSRDDSSQRPY